MIITIPKKYYLQGYTLLYERLCIELLEERGIGFYPYIKDIELILLTIKQNYENNLNIEEIHVNDLPDCYIPFADDLLIRISNDFTDTYGEYDPMDTYTKYNNKNNKFDSAVINIYVKPNENGEFNESRYRLVIAHELVHLRDDYEIRKASNNDISLITTFVNGNLDNGKIQTDVSRNNPIAKIIYRLFINTEIHALSSQMYMDMYSLYKENNSNLKRENAYKDILNTDTMKEYNNIKNLYIELVKNNIMFENFAIKYFPKWYNKFLSKNNMQDRNKVKLQFKKWFINIAEISLENIFNRITKAASLFYDDHEIDNSKLYTLNTKINLKKEYIKKLNENFNTNYNYPDEIIKLKLFNKFGKIVNINIRYNKCIEK